MSEVVFLTGAAGFVGSHLTEKLLEQGHEVIAYDLTPLEQARNLQNVKSHKGLRYVEGDIRDRKKLEQSYSHDVKRIYHLASIVGVHKYIDDPFGLIDITIGGTRNVAELALSNQARLLFTSTSEVFGKNPSIPWTEEHDRVLGPTKISRWSYSSSKGVCEHILFALHYQKELPITVVRYFNAYGPRQAPIFVVSQSVYKVLKGEKPLLYDGGSQTRCFTYIDDVVRGTILAAESDKAIGEDFNLGNDKEVTMKEVVELVIKYSGKNLTWENLDTSQHYGKTYEDIPRRVPSHQKAKELLGWGITVPHTEGIKRTVEWSSQNDWWLA